MGDQSMWGYIFRVKCMDLEGYIAKHSNTTTQISGKWGLISQKVKIMKSQQTQVGTMVGPSWLQKDSGQNLFELKQSRNA